MNVAAFNKEPFRFFLLISACFLWHASMSFSQTPTQVIRGEVRDAVSGQILVGASIVLPGTEPLKGATTDEGGIYRLDDIPVGRYSLQATYVGYEMVVIPEILVESGKEAIIHIFLNERSENLGEIVVRSPERYNTSLSPVSVRTITVEEGLRFPATFIDPARLAITYAGVTNTNDQANHISVRGNSPNSLSWRLEGAEIVNPNHLGDAGTISQRPTQSGGGVNILSAQLLGTSHFYSSAFPIQYGNAIGGIMDMRFRNGNNEKHEFTAQAGLIGFDFSAEGPLSKERGISYLLNYRYSFVGLITSLGVDFGGETISFQDLAFNLTAPIGNRGLLKVFGMGGNSENAFEGKRDSLARTEDKEWFDITFTNSMGAGGISYTSTLGEKATFKMATIVSAQQTNKRTDMILNETEVQSGYFYDSLLYRKTAFTAELNYKLNNKHTFTVGTSPVHHLFDINTENFQDRSLGRADGWLVGSFGRWSWSPADRWQIQAGVHHSFFSLNDQSVLEPRSAITWRMTAIDRFSISYGLHSQVQAGQNYLVYFPGQSFVNEALGLTRSHHLVAGYTRQLGSKGELTVEAYFQSLFDVPVNTSPYPPARNFSAINQIGDYKRWELVNEGSGQNYGIELTWQRFIRDGYFWLANATVYESTYKAHDGALRDSRFNGNYLFNFTGGKEFSWQKKGRQKILGINARATYAGGLRYSPIDEEASALGFYMTTEDSFNPFSLQLNDYFKVDCRIYLKTNKSKFNSMVALDLQNLANTRNDAYYYYDITQGKTVLQQQLGLIPNLSYRVEF